MLGAPPFPCPQCKVGRVGRATRRAAAATQPRGCRRCPLTGFPGTNPPLRSLACCLPCLTLCSWRLCSAFAKTCFTCRGTWEKDDGAGGSLKPWCVLRVGGLSLRRPFPRRVILALLCFSCAPRRVFVALAGWMPVLMPLLLPSSLLASLAPAAQLLRRQRRHAPLLALGDARRPGGPHRGGTQQRQQGALLPTFLLPRGTRLAKPEKGQI